MNAMSERERTIAFGLPGLCGIRGSAGSRTTAGERFGHWMRTTSPEELDDVARLAPGVLSPLGDRRGWRGSEHEPSGPTFASRDPTTLSPSLNVVVCEASFDRAVC
jgi:hypothetical protein